jgi:hypothetical protein
MERRNSYDKVYPNLSGILDVSCDLKRCFIRCSVRPNDAGNNPIARQPPIGSNNASLTGTASMTTSGIVVDSVSIIANAFTDNGLVPSRLLGSNCELSISDLAIWHQPRIARGEVFWMNTHPL